MTNPETGYIAQEQRIESMIRAAIGFIPINELDEANAEIEAIMDEVTEYAAERVVNALDEELVRATALDTRTVQNEDVCRALEIFYPPHGPSDFIPSSSAAFSHMHAVLEADRRAATPPAGAGEVTDEDMERAGRRLERYGIEVAGTQLAIRHMLEEFAARRSPANAGGAGTVTDERPLPTYTHETLSDPAFVAAFFDGATTRKAQGVVLARLLETAKRMADRDNMEAIYGAMLGCEGNSIALTKALAGVVSRDRFNAVAAKWIPDEVADAMEAELFASKGISTTPKPTPTGLPLGDSK